MTNLFFICTIYISIDDVDDAGKKSLCLPVIPSGQIDRIENEKGEKEDTMFSIDPGNKDPLYKQIIDQFFFLAAKEMIQDGDQLPSIRELAEKLGINPNTVARSYQELERLGYIVTIPKKGTYVSGGNPQRLIAQQAKEALTNWFEKYLSLGILPQTLKEISEEVIHA